MDDYEFIGESYDKQGNFISNYYNYSKLVQLLPSKVDILQKELPEFTITQLYGNWYIVGFNKTITTLNL